MIPRMAPAPSPRSWLGHALSAASALAACGWHQPAQAQDRTVVESCLNSYESAQRLRIGKHLGEARRQLLSCGEATCPAAIRKDCLRWLDEVDRSMPSVVMAVRFRGQDLTAVRVLVDGTQIATRLDGASIAVDPGTRQFRFEASGYKPRERTVVIREGEKNRPITVELPAEAASDQATSHAPALALAALGVAGLGFFTYFGLKGMSGKSDLELCKGHCSQSDANTVGRNFLAADIALGVGVVALGAAAYLYFSDGPPRQASAASARRSLWIDVSSGRALVGANVGWRF